MGCGQLGQKYPLWVAVFLLGPRSSWKAPSFTEDSDKRRAVWPQDTLSGVAPLLWICPSGHKHSPAALHHPLRALSHRNLMGICKCSMVPDLSDTILGRRGCLIGCCPVGLNTGDSPDDFPCCSSVAQPLTLDMLSRGPLATLPASISYKTCLAEALSLKIVQSHLCIR